MARTARVFTARAPRGAPGLKVLLAAFLLLGAAGPALAQSGDETERPASPAAGLPINFDHLDHLSQLFEVEGEQLRGVWIYAEPGIGPDAPYQYRGATGEGVTDLDDVARAAIAYLWAAEQDGLETTVPHALEYARGQLEYVLAMQAENGEFFNFVFEDGSINRLGITSRKGAGFWAARALWALAEGMHAFREEDPEFYALLQSAFLLGVEPFARQVDASYGEYIDAYGFRAPAWFPGDGSDVASILLLGLTTYLELETDDTTYLLASRLADGLTEFQYGPPQEYPYLAHQSFARDPLQWHAWGSRQTQALARAARVMDDHPDAAAWLASAEAEAGHFFVQLLASQGPVESMRPAVKSGPQIAFGMESLASGLFELHAATGKEVYAELGGLMTSWLTGNNELRERMYDPTSGRTYDGLERGVINRNSGAESTITALLALLQANRSEVAADALDWQWLWKLDDVVVELETGLDFGEPPEVESDSAASGQLVAVLQPGAAVVVDAVVPSSGEYRLQALHRNDPWDASATIALGQQRLGTISNVGDGPAHHRLVDLGVVSLEAGETRFVVSHAGGDELRFDAIVLRPLLTQKLYGREGERMLLVKSWADEPVDLDAGGLVSEALAAIGAQERGDLTVRVYDRFANQQDDAAVLPAFGFAIISFASSEALPDLRTSSRVDREPVTVEFAFSQGPFHGLALDALFNNDAFSDSRNPAKGNFDSRSGALGATYMAERAPAANEVFELGGVSLLFPPSEADANNVAMFGQRLVVPSGHYAAIWVLGSSEQGNYQMPVTLEYADGSSEQVDLGLSDWCQLPRYGEPALLEFPQRRGAGGAIERITCRIFLQRLSVDPSKELTRIGLPDRETMHAFAITLEEP
ncbi:MAG TPA: hypothetical protein VFD39_10145 [Trueperaceae bacterium]|nr:hypothetical protein [Trueperaceae bacterium]